MFELVSRYSGVLIQPSFLYLSLNVLTRMRSSEDIYLHARASKGFLGEGERGKLLGPIQQVALSDFP